MRPQLWAIVLQWSRLGVTAMVFLVAARMLPLETLGLFAMLYAPVRLTQGLHKAGIAEAVIIGPEDGTHLAALAWLSLALGAVLAGGLAVAAAVLEPVPRAALLALSLVPLAHALAALPDGVLRRAMRIRALALRTLAAQGLAGVAALAGLFLGAGLWALVGFVLLSTVLNAVLSIWLAGWPRLAWPTRRDLHAALGDAARIGARDLAGAALAPLCLLAVGGVYGLAAAGALQIAFRVLALLEALALAPLRYIALPTLRAERAGPGFAAALDRVMTHSAAIGLWGSVGVYVAGPDMLHLLVGPGKAAAVSPLLLALVPTMMVAALAMPLNQALTSTQATGTVLLRALAHLVLALVAGAAGLLAGPFGVALGLSVSALAVHLWYMRRAAGCLPIPVPRMLPGAPVLAAGFVMALGLAALPDPGPSALHVLVQIALGTALFGGVLALLRPAARRVPA